MAKQVWQKGESGNPAGRPPKSRALTSLLEQAGSKTIDNAEGKKTARKRLIAELAWQILTTGKAIFPDGTVLEAAPKDWLETVKWVYSHIDGPPKQAVELTGKDGGPIEHRDTDITDEARAARILAILEQGAAQRGGLAVTRAEATGAPEAE